MKGITLLDDKIYNYSPYFSPRLFCIVHLKSKVSDKILRLKRKAYICASYYRMHYASLTNLRSGLYTQSTPYIYEYLENELATGKMG